MTSEHPADDLRRELARVVQRLRALGPARLGASVPGGHDSIADAARRVVQMFADAAAPVEDRPAYRVPQVGDHAIADQVAVVGGDLLTVADSVPGQVMTDLVVAARQFRRRI